MLFIGDKLKKVSSDPDVWQEEMRSGQQTGTFRVTLHKDGRYRGDFITDNGNTYPIKLDQAQIKKALGHDNPLPKGKRKNAKKRT